MGRDVRKAWERDGVDKAGSLMEKGSWEENWPVRRDADLFKKVANFLSFSFF